jgi:SAM-dependent methyltransferase
VGERKWWRRDEGHVPVGIDPATPSPARMYDYFLGGKDNFPSDREAADKVKAVIPNTYDIVWENRRFLQRTVRHLAGRGVRQFIDIGAGLPTQGNVHQIAQEVIPDARVVYVDNDPIVLAHGRALLAENDTTTVVQADLRDPATILEHPELHALIDFEQPFALLLVAIFHFIADEYDPEGLAAAYRDVLPSGGYLTLSHLTSTGADPAGVAATEAVYQSASSPIIFRPKDRIEGFFEGLDLIDPGLVHLYDWHPDGQEEFRTGWLYGGVARKP